ncbi:MAG: radical SAM family heme chaperone HemW [Geodermatophilaceae bacterium]|nr:coproporphyrinogen III oxidase [Geodermatophilaceae bacterium]
MPSTLPDGDPAPPDGSLPASALASLGDRALGFYVHVPFCASRCGYCDFNTYTARELGGGASQLSYVDTAIAEVRLAAHVLGPDAPPLETVFFGGGTPTLLPSEHLAAILGEVRDRLGFASDAEITTEANPESVTARSLHRLRQAGFTRISLGMQSAREHVLGVLDRRHTPGRAAAAVAEARAAGFEHINLDLIYGTPGETAEDWQASLDAAIEANPDHVSAYALIVEDGTALARRVARGEIPAPDDDVLADYYEQADVALAQAGYLWYEVANWSAGRSARSRHNELYWTGADWWGIGPGAHSHVGGVRWWNVKHPAAYAGLVEAGRSPAHAREVLGPQARRTEQIMLGLRLRDGLSVSLLSAAGRRAAEEAVGYGLLSRVEHLGGRAVLTLRGRLLADAVVRSLLD